MARRANLKNKAFADKFTITDLKKVNDKVHLGGKHDEGEFQWIPWDGFNNYAKGSIKTQLEISGISLERYVRYGAADETAITSILRGDSANSNLIRILLPDPDAIASFNVDEGVRGQTQYVLQVDYQRETTFAPIATVKVVKSESANLIHSSGISISHVVKAIATAEYEPPFDDYFFKSVAKVTLFRTCPDFLHIPKLSLYNDVGLCSATESLS